MERRSFLTLLAAGVGTGWLAACTSQPRLAAPASAASHGFQTAFFLEGQFAGWVEASGGSQIATQGMPDVVPGHPTRLPPAPRRFHDLILEAGAGVAPEFYAWLAESLASGEDAERSGVLTGTDAAGRPMATESWRGRIAQIEFPSLSRDDCSPARLRVRIALAEARPEGVSKAVLPPRPTRSWPRCNFRMGITGLDSVAGTATSVSALTCTRARQVSFGPLALTVPASAAAAFSTWRSAGDVRRGGLTFLDAQEQPVVALALSGLTPTSVSAAGGEARIQLAVGDASLAVTG